MPISGVACDGDLSSPEATVTGYCNSEGKVVQKYFNYPVDDIVKSKRPWSKCRIVKVFPTDDVGKRYGDLVVQKEDIEVIIEVHLIDPRPENTKTKFYPKTRFSYLVREIDEKWKIIAHSHIPDEHHPAYD